MIFKRAIIPGAVALLAAAGALQAEILRFKADLSGAQEVPAVTTDATGRAELYYDTMERTYTLYVQVQGLTSELTMSHIHEAPLGENGPPVISLGGEEAYVGAAGGFFAGKFEGAYSADLGALLAGAAYVNVHTADFPGGEVRGQLMMVPTEAERLVNFSGRGRINPARGPEGTLIGGFVLTQPRRVLARSLGESLAEFGVQEPRADSAIALFNADGEILLTNDNWGDSQTIAVQATGLAPFAETDSAIVTTLPAGAYTVQADASKGSGIALLELYSLPDVSLVDQLVAAGNFTTLLAAVEAAGLVDVLSGPGPFTLFAPTDEAFAALPAGTLDTLLQPANRAMLTSILLYHLVPAEAFSAGLSEGQMVPTLLGSDLTISLEDGPRVNDATIVEVDLDVSNGVIHPIDAVLLPPEA